LIGLLKSKKSCPNNIAQRNNLCLASVRFATLLLPSPGTGSQRRQGTRACGDNFFVYIM